VRELWRSLSLYFSFLAVFVYHLVISYHDFLAFFSPSSLVFYHVYFLCIWERFMLLIISQLLIKKKKKKKRKKKKETFMPVALKLHHSHSHGPTLMAEELE
jgi:hypothetical protein